MSRLGDRIGPIGSGYFLFYIIGYVILIFAVGLLTFNYGSAIIDTLFTDRPCLLWVFVLVCMMIGLAMIWIAQRQGKRRQ